MSTDPSDFVHSIDAPSPEEVEAAAIAYFVAVQPNRRKPADWEGVAGVWKKSYRGQSLAALTAAAEVRSA